MFKFLKSKLLANLPNLKIPITAVVLVFAIGFFAGTLVTQKLNRERQVKNLANQESQAKATEPTCKIDSQIANDINVWQKLSEKLVQDEFNPNLILDYQKEVKEENKSLLEEFKKAFAKEIDFIQTFEKYRTEEKGEELMALFEPPQNEKEKEEYEFITFKDTPGVRGYRLFGTNILGSKTDYCLITNIQQNSDLIKAEVSEVRILLDRVSSLKNFNDFDGFILEFKPVNGSFLIISYHYSEEQDNPVKRTKKYEGLFSKGF